MSDREIDEMIVELFLQLTEEEKDDALSYASKMIDEDEQYGCQ